MANSGAAANVQSPQKKVVGCGECGTYAQLCKKSAGKDRGKTRYERDHIPAKATLRERAFKLAGKGLKKAQKRCIAYQVEQNGIAIAIPRSAHRDFSPTCGTKNKPLMKNDASSKKKLDEAVDRDLAEMPSHLDPKCAKAYKQAAKRVKEHDNEKVIRDAIKKCTK
ncbi:MAG: hypothetical protein ABI356_12305 [Steroidobacteraceae bacterium]